MRIREWLLKKIEHGIDHLYARLPQPFPGPEKLARCKIVSHRGVYDNQTVFENTVPAFEKVEQGGVWGIEFDVRWTRDLHPVVFHDADCQRLFHSALRINAATLAGLKERFPVIPTLEEVIDRFGKKVHLMVEIKEEVYPDPARQCRRLETLFASLTPREDFHFISLAPEMFKKVEFVPPSTFLPVAEFNIYRFSALSRHRNYGGVNGHYLLLTNRLLNKHRRRGQQVGTGFVCSKNCLFREINRGIEWIFSDNAVELQEICDATRRGSAGGDGGSGAGGRRGG